MWRCPPTHRREHTRSAWSRVSRRCPSPAGFQVQPANASLPQIDAVVNSSYQQVFYPGSAVAVFGSNLAASSALLQLSLNDTPLTPQFASASQINFTIPQGFPTGPAILKLNNGSTSAFPLEIQIDVPAPQIQNVSGPSGNAGSPGDVLTALASGIDPAAANPNRLQVTVSGVPMTILQVTPQGGQVQIQFVLAQSFGGSRRRWWYRRTARPAPPSTSPPGSGRSRRVTLWQ